MKKDDIFYGEDGDEELIDHRDDAIVKAFESFPDKWIPMPESVTLSRFKRMEITNGTEYEAEMIVENLLEKLDDEYGGPDPSVPTKEMIEQANKFVRGIYDLYVPWACEKIETEVVSKAEYEAICGGQKNEKN